jgi:general secretion pathway protein C
VNEFRNFAKTLAPYLLFVFIGYCIADLMIMNYRDLMIPTQPPPSKPKKQVTSQTVSRSYLNTIVTRNIFNWDGKIPDAIVPKGEVPGSERNDVPVPSSLPLTLVGTIVHSNPKKSIANVEIKSKNTVLPFSPGRDIEGMALLQEVLRGKIIFQNTNNNRLEYIEMKTQGSKLSFAQAAPAAGGGGDSEVRETAPNTFEVKRADILKYTANMAQVLQQAAMAPKRNANGEIECYKFLNIQPGSIYTQLKFQVGDCLSGVNGEKIDSPAKAMELYGSLKNTNNLSLSFERDGQKIDYNYKIK